MPSHRNGVTSFARLRAGQVRCSDRGVPSWLAAWGKEGVIIVRRVTGDEAQTEARVEGGAGLSPKRSAWLLRVGQRLKVPSEALDQCMEYLQNASGVEVKEFFDELARCKVEVFTPFWVAW